MRTKSDFKVKWKTFVIFKWLSVLKSCLGPETEPLIGVRMGEKVQWSVCMNWVKIVRNSHREVFCKKTFTGKHLHESLFFNEVAGLRPEAINFIKKETLVQLFSCECFYRIPLVAGSISPLLKIQRIIPLNGTKYSWME